MSRSKNLNVEPLPIGKSVMISYLISSIAYLNFQISDSNFCMSICIIFFIQPLGIFDSLIKFGFWTSIQRAIWVENVSHEHLQGSAYMNVDDFHVQVHLGPLLACTGLVLHPFNHSWHLWQSSKH
jgi:hypothetical protein